MRFLISIPLLLATACNFINPVEPEPHYIYIPDIRLITDYVDQGSSSDNFADAWVYLDNQPLGSFELPAYFPVLEGSGTLQVFAGIKERGISNTRMPYPMTAIFETDFSYTPATVDTIYPSIRYREDVLIPLREDFESGNDFSGMTVTSQANLVFEGSKSGAVFLDESSISFVALSQPYELPGNGTRVFLEFDYRNDGPFNVLLQANRPNGNNVVEYMITVNPRDTWNKIYIDMTSLTSGLNGDNFQVVFAGQMPLEDTEAVYLFDNVKIVHF